MASFQHLQTAATSNPLEPATYERTRHEFANRGAFAVIKKDGSVVAWGDPYTGGEVGALSEDLSSSVTQIFTSGDGFAALKADGSVVSWGGNVGAAYEGVKDQLKADVLRIYSTSDAFAALKSNGSVVTWGYPWRGGDSSAVMEELLSGVVDIVSTWDSFAALKENGTVVTWGNVADSGSASIPSSLNNVKSLYSTTNGAFAALKQDGSVATWGAGAWGGYTITPYRGSSEPVAPPLMEGVEEIFSTAWAFAALKDDGSVYTWGSTDIQEQDPYNPNYKGGTYKVANSGVIDIVSTNWAFAALKEDGSVLTWGHDEFGGDISQVAERLNGGIRSIFATSGAFAALNNDGSVVTWGSPGSGGDSSLASNGLSSGITKIYAGSSAFTAIRNDGKVITWGAKGWNDSLGSFDFYQESDTEGIDGSQIKDVFVTSGNFGAFAALMNDGEVVTWGDPSVGGNTDSVSSQLKDVIAFANPFSDDWLSISAKTSAFLPRVSSYGYLHAADNAFWDSGGDEYSFAVSTYERLGYPLTGVAEFEISSLLDVISSGNTLAFLARPSSVFAVFAPAKTVHIYLSGGDGVLDISDITESGERVGDLIVESPNYWYSEIPYYAKVVLPSEAILNIHESGYDYLRIQGTTDDGSVLFSEIKIVSLVNKAPTALSLSSSSFNENITPSSAVATISSTDPDSDDTFTYALVAGTGDADNAAFSIDGNQLKIKASPDFESKSTYSIRIETRDSGGLTFEKSFTLDVIDADEYPIIRGNSLYTIVSGPNWKQAEDNSVMLGGHLASIASQEEQDFIWNQFKTYGFIGLTDESEEGIWRWSDGTDSDYSNWAPGAPDNAVSLTLGGISQDYAVMGWPLAEIAGQWDDQWHQQVVEGLPGIAEIPFARGGDSAYVIVKGSTWEEAEANANALGGHLVTINNEKENSSLHSTFQIYEEYPRFFWTGLIDRENNGDWQWVSGDEVSYLNWSSNEGVAEPDGGTSSSYMYLGRYPFKWNLVPPKIQDGTAGKWSNVPLAQGDMEGGIAEIKLAPNNLPTGAPTIIGDLRVGSTIAIETSGIIDADNGKYWTPSYSYYWRFSRDKLSWVVVTTQDGLDFDETLEITEDLAGAYIQGVIGYLDGQGTVELVDTSWAMVKPISFAKRVVSLPSDLTAKVGQVIEIPISIDQSQDLQAFDLTFAFDPTLFSVPTAGDLIRGGSVTEDWTVTGNVLPSNTAIKISGFTTIPASSGEGDLAYLRLKVNGNAPRGEALLDLVSASLNERGLAVDLQDGLVTITAPKVSITAGLKAPVGGSIGIPISIDDATGLQSIDLVFAYDPTTFSIPTSGQIVGGSDLTSGWSFTANTDNAGEIRIAGYGTTPLSGGEGGLINLNLKINSGIETGTALLDLVSASFNEGAITADLIDGTLELLPSSFQVMDVRQTASGLALKLSEAPDLDKLNLYDGQDDSIDLPDLRLTRSDGSAVGNLSLHWKADTSELHVIHTDSLTGITQTQFDAGASPFQSDLLASGDYTLVIDARSDGLISASNGELIDGNGDGITGDAFSYSFTKIAPENAISIGDTARGSGQALGLNGIAHSNGISGLPVLISTTASIRQLRGKVTYDATVFNNASLVVGRDLPEDWTIETQEDLIGSIAYNASGTTAITGTDQELFRFDAVVSQGAEYGSSTLIEATAEAPEDLNLTFEEDPSLVVLAYSGDTTGNGGEEALSSLDASRVQRVVVELDSGFDPYDTIAPTLIGDTTGNGTLSSLDASRIQQEVVGLPVTSFPSIPELPPIA